MKKLIIGSTLGIVIGAGGMFGLAHIPSVNAFISKDTSTNSSITEDLKLKEENSTLKLNIQNLNTQLDTAKIQLTSKDEIIKEKETLIVSLTSDKQTLESQLAKLNQDFEDYKNQTSTGDYSSYIEQINLLQSQLDSITSDLNSANSELNQLRLDKETLTTRISELESNISILEEELAKYKVLGDIDVLKAENFNGKWYLDGTFADYYIIENGVVTHNASEDTGVIQCLNNQMYLFMNNSGSKPVNLSVDGNSFTTEDGQYYTKFYVNTTESVLPTYSHFVGTYSNNSDTYILNGDNTLSYSDGTNTYYGSYLVTSIKKNIGGNSVITNNISATINIDDTQVTKEFEVVSLSTQLVDINENISYSQVSAVPFVLSNSASAEYTIPNYYLKITVKTNRPVHIPALSSVEVLANFSTYATSSSNRVKANPINGVQYGSSNSYLSAFDGTHTLYNSTSEDVDVMYFDFYITHAAYSRLSGIVSVGGVDCDVIDVVDNYNNDILNLITSSSSIYDLYQAKQCGVGKITCSQVDDYIYGEYTLVDGQLAINSDGAIITPADGVQITATSCNVVAETDGYDIYHVVTIKYNHTIDNVSTSHTLIINYKNDNVVSATLNGADTTVIKN